MILHGDCLEKLSEMADNSVDAVVTDPPYGWRFMGKAWDGADIEKVFKRDCTLVTDNKTTRGMAAGKYDQSPTANEAFEKWTEMWAREAFRVLKPGGHMLVFCGPRTYHRMASGVEDAGFEIRDQLQWLFGSGFPKSHSIDKAIDKMHGAEREIVGTRAGGLSVKDGATDLTNSRFTAKDGLLSITAPATPDAIKWAGWGTALKPANEPIVLARKPIEGTVAQNVLKHGVGGLNIDACRIGTEVRFNQPRGTSGPTNSMNALGHGPGSMAQGRWPANVIFDECAASLLDEQSGVSKPKPERTGKRGGKDWHPGFDKNANPIGTWPADPGGGASRFFYVAKASKRERNAGCEGMEEREMPADGPLAWGVHNQTGKPNKPPESQKNHHPTVKPIKLMEYLIRLITPPGGIVLDPFCGSGSTGVAARKLGFEFIGIEMNEEYVAIAERRIEAAI